jgi:hypothetical protein
MLSLQLMEIPTYQACRCRSRSLSLSSVWGKGSALLLQKRKQTMKYHTIVNSFKDSGMWPVSTKEGLKRMRAYNNRQKRTSDELEDEGNNHQPELPTIKRQATELWDTSAAIRALGDRDPTKFSDYSISLFYKTMQDVDIHL